MNRFASACSIHLVMAVAVAVLTLPGDASAFTNHAPTRTGVVHRRNIDDGSIFAYRHPRRTHRAGSSVVGAATISIPETTTPRSVVGAEEDWIVNLDFPGFAREVSALGKEMTKSSSQDDVDHLNKLLRWRDLSALIGIATMWMTPNPLTVAALSTWTYASWTMVAHHTCHGGYNRVDAGRYNSRGFALGTVRRRIQDWCDWMLPEAWNIEHNRLHHYHLGEIKDPDLVQNNLQFLREMDIPMVAKYAVVAFFIPVWKWFYYAPNTYKELKVQQYRKEGRDFPEQFRPNDVATIRTLLFPDGEKDLAAREVLIGFWTDVLAPFFVSRFLLLPAPLLLIPGGAGPALFGHAILNLMFADLLTNVHAFVTIVTNHAGDDVYTFDDEVKPKTGSFYVRQIVGSVNYEAGTDLVDFSHGWLNYQIEHHCFPDLSMLQYQRAAPRLREICDRYGVPYVQESVFTRLRKTIDVMVGRSTMKVFPTHLEPQSDKAGRAGVTWKSTNGAIDDDEEE